MRLDVLLLLALVACGDKESDDSAADDSQATDDSEATGLEIVGSYTDSWGGSHTVTEESWVSGDSSWAISGYDNAGGFLVAQNAATNTYFPGEWSRFDWVWEGSDLYYCQIAYEADSEADALAADTADGASLDAGCNGFSWTQLTPAQ